MDSLDLESIETEKDVVPQMGLCRVVCQVDSATGM
jgi:hypothetical protein